jgi:hypothetical protein
MQGHEMATDFICKSGQTCEDPNIVGVQGSYATAAAAAADPDWGEEASGGWGYEDEGPAQAKQFKVRFPGSVLGYDPFRSVWHLHG